MSISWYNNIIIEIGGDMFKKIESFDRKVNIGITLVDIREKMSNRLLIGAFLITFMELLLFIGVKNVNYKVPIILIYVLIYSLGLFSLIKEEKILHETKGKIFLVIFFLLGSVTFSQFGGLSSIMMFTFGIITCLLYFNNKVSTYYILAVMLTLFVLGMRLNLSFDISLVTTDIFGVFSWLIKSIFIGIYLFSIFSAIYLLIKYTKTSNKELEKVALYDSLTNLPNKLQFKKSLNRIINDSSVESFGVLYIDLDNFKKINDIFGRFTGDRILYTIAKRLKALEYKEDLFARISGDEFILLIKNKIHKKISQENIEKLR